MEHERSRSTEQRPSSNISSPALSRREFMQATGAAAAGLVAGGMTQPVMAGPFDNEYLKIIPADKKLDPTWVRSLYEPGHKQTYSTGQLKYIGMPVGGIGAGHVYLGGDGRLWLWEIFNKSYPRGFLGKGAGGETFRNPFEQIHPFQQGFSLRLRGAGVQQVRSLDSQGFAHVTFDGRYPMGWVHYSDPACPVEVSLEAFSPFIPLDLENSGYPATVIRYTVQNTGADAVEVTLAGWTDNPVCLYSGQVGDTLRRNRIERGDRWTVLQCTAERPPQTQAVPKRPDILFEDFEKTTYEGWTVEGQAFGAGPVAIEDIPSYQGDVKGSGRRVANSHASAPGDSVGSKDSATGSLLSRPFTIERHYISFRIGGGNHNPQADINMLTGKGDAGGTGIELWVDGKVVRFVTGHDANQMRIESMDVSDLEGKTAQLKIVDRESGGWGNVGVDEVIFTDERKTEDAGPLEQRYDFGTLALALVGQADHAAAGTTQHEIFATDNSDATGPWGERLTGALSKLVTLDPGERKTVTFVFAWYFPHLSLARLGHVGRYYTRRFADAAAVARHVAGDVDRLYDLTRRWTDTWYDSTLPGWLLDRTMANTSILATNTFYHFENGRFYGWEGINCCEGTCAHVWHYAQAPGRLFPEIERSIRQRVDFGLAFGEDGAIHYRGEFHDQHADDGQCGRILGVLREHQMSVDDSFLRRLWPKVKKSIEFMIERDADADGLLNGAQPNTLDANWYGKISFTSSLYLAALKAGEQMALEVEDRAFAERCRTIAANGAQNILQTYNGEYFYQIEDPAHHDQIGVGPGCYIDQIFGQTWAHWVALGRLFDRERQLSALRALWKYNFVPDVGPFREYFQRGRWYAMAGDAGLIMCSWPKGGKNPHFAKHWQYGYFNECMSGFEWQAAAHMIWESHDQPDLLEKGLAVGRAIHDRYDGRRRNPYNEIECSDHYARSMASYGVFLATCGFEYHGPKGHIGFAPRLQPEDFRAAFTAAEGWGTFNQRQQDRRQVCTIVMRYGQLRLTSMALVVAENAVVDQVRVNGEDMSFHQQDRRVLVGLPAPRVLHADEETTIELILREVR
ncbi:MAG: GH116 family glycosyl-hydrolase [Planctomycetota bacterium]|nr:GH116 family glycosyl-hydrolase [Planctomycetota bacterium]